MIGHSAYITFGSKVENIEIPYQVKKPEKEEFIDLDGMPLKG